NESANSSEVSAAPGFYKGWVFAWNPVAYWPLNETAGNIAIDLVRGSNGVLAGGFSRNFNGPVGAGFGTPHRATHFDGATGYTQLPLLIGSTNFTIVFWVQTTATGGTPNWYNGKGLVDGEVVGAVNDFGIALVGAKVGFGIGNPDTTLTSVKSINNNVWHQVAATWDAGNGAMKLFIDGALDASGTGPTGARTAPPSLRVASIQTAGNYLLGNISDIAMYDQVLSSNQVATLYSAASGLFYNITLTNSWSSGHLVLNWPGNGKLLEATNLTGPWTTNNSVAPVTVVPSLPQRFYRVQTR
ncbi:MAG: LamG domain protein jellyroll fold domain protein, partial [Pedosphaera sp.]|nr:LamG domain protein jellyroll fold domain protein [Pedosphaera sp.]